MGSRKARKAGVRVGGHDAPPDAPPMHQERPKERVSQPAVGWLLGPELLANLRSIVRQKSRRGNPRTWMPATPGIVHDEVRSRDGLPRPLAENGAGIAGDEPEAAEIWFDYIADL